MKRFWCVVLVSRVFHLFGQSSTSFQNGYLNDKSNAGLAPSFVGIYSVTLITHSHTNTNCVLFVDTPEPPNIAAAVTQQQQQHNFWNRSKIHFPNSNNRIYFISINGLLSRSPSPALCHSISDPYFLENVSNSILSVVALLLLSSAAPFARPYMRECGFN